MICSDVRDRLFDQLYGLVDGDELRALETHLRSCPACSAEKARASEQRGLLRAEPPPAVPPGLADRALRRLAPSRRVPFRALAAAAGLLIAAGLVWIASRQDGLVWESDGLRRALADGERLSARAEGVLAYPDGSLLSLKPGARLQARSRRSVLLEDGEIFCRVSPSGERFVVSTPVADVVVLGTEFTVSLRGDEKMDRSKAIGSGLLLTVAVAGGVVLVTNGAGEVTLRADEAAAVRAGEAPARVADADERKISDQAKAVAAEAESLRAEAEDLRRAGRLLLAERRRPQPAPAPPTKADKQFADVMRAQMKVMMKGKAKEAVDKLDRQLAFSAEQRREAEALYEQAFGKLIEAFAEGKFGDFEDEDLETEIDGGLSKLLRPDQRQTFEKLRQEEREATRLRQREEERRGFASASDAMGLSPGERIALEPFLAGPLLRFREADAKLQVKALTGGMSMEALRAAQAELRQKLLGDLKERLAPDRLDALRLHLEKLSSLDQDK